MKYKVNRIEGEYAYLIPIDSEVNEELFIAMALLPPGVDVDCILNYENLEFSFLD